MYDLSPRVPVWRKLLDGTRTGPGTALHLGDLEFGNYSRCLPSGAIFEYRVRALDKAGQAGPWSAVAYGRVAQYLGPKKIIKNGSDEMNPSVVKLNIDRMQATPFDGIVMGLRSATGGPQSRLFNAVKPRISTLCARLLRMPRAMMG